MKMKIYLRKNVEYVNLDSINGNISIINFDKIINNEDEKESSEINEKVTEEEKAKMDIDEDINIILNQEITDNYNNYNSIII